MLKCIWNLGNESECEGEVKVVDLFPTSPSKHEIDDCSVHSMPICKRHLHDHITILGAMVRGKTEEVLSTDNINGFDLKLS